MSLHLVIRTIHIISASLWMGLAFFAGWFLMPAIKETGPDGGKVMMAIQRRGMMVVVPVVALLTVLSGIYMYYTSYMGTGSGPAIAYSAGGGIGLLAMILGAGIVSRSASQAEALTVKSVMMADGPDKAKNMARIGELRGRMMLFTRIVSILIIVTAVIMISAIYW